MGGIIETLLISVICFFVILYDIIAFPVYMIIYTPLCSMRKSKYGKVREVKIGDAKCKTYVFTVPNAKQEDIYSGLETVNSLLKHTLERHRYKKCLGTREILHVKVSFKQDGTKIYKYIVGPYKWMTYNTVKDRVLELSRGLRSLGIEPKTSLALLMETREEWLISAIACFERDLKLIALDISMDMGSVIQTLQDTKIFSMITSEEVLPKVLNYVDSLPTVKFIIYIERYEKATVLRNFPNTVVIYTYSAVCERGKNLIIEGSPPNPDDVAVIIFTKGTTGPPKGMPFSQRYLVSAMKCYQSRLRFTDKDVMIGYHPLSNLVEFVLELTMMMAGGAIGYSSNFVDPDRNMKVIFGTYGDATALEPTVMFAYPYLIKEFSESISVQLKKFGLFTRSLVNFGIIYKKFWVPKHFGTPLTNRIIFPRLARMVGGKMRMIICGGAYLTASAQLYSAVTLCSSVIQLYMQTESSAIGLCQSDGNVKMGQLGKPLEGVYVRLEQVLEKNCISKKPAAELILGGHCINQWCTNIPGVTEEYFMDGDIRWFRTGDIVIKHRDGSFEFIDRKVNIIKLEDGKCVALGKLEAIYKISEAVNNIYLHGEEGKKFLVAILIPDREYMSRVFPYLGINFSQNNQLLTEGKMRNAVADLLIKHAKSCNLSDHEIPAAVTLVDDEWTLESGLVTTTYQLKRGSAYEKYETQIASMYDAVSKGEKKSGSKKSILVFFGGWTTSS